MWGIKSLSSPPSRSLVRRTTAEAEWFGRLQEHKPLTWSKRNTSPSPVYLKSNCAVIELKFSTKPLHTTAANATTDTPATEQRVAPVVSPSKKHPRGPTTPPLSRKRRRPQGNGLSHPSPSKRPRTRVTREPTLIPNLIDLTTTLHEQWGSGKTPSLTNPTVYLPTPKTSSPGSPHVKKHSFGSLPFHLLIEDAFLLVCRPIYPIIRRPKGKPALSTLLPADRLLHTLEALLIGCGWSSRRTPVPKGIKRGIVFVDTSDGETVTNLIQTLLDKEELKNKSTNASQAKAVLVISKEYLDHFYSYSGGRTIDGRDVKVDLIWASE